MLELACQEGKDPLPICAIADRQDIPSRFLEAILRQLKQAGLTESVRGKEGGYRLAKPASHITMGEIIHLFEGPLLPSHGESSPGQPDIFSEIFTRGNTALAEVFEHTRFSDLANQYKDLKRSTIVDYSI